MNDPIDNGTFCGYHRLALAIIERAIRDTRLKQIALNDWMTANKFLTSPESQCWADGWGINLEWINEQIERELQ